MSPSPAPLSLSPGATEAYLHDVLGRILSEPPFTVLDTRTEWRMRAGWERGGFDWWTDLDFVSWLSSLGGGDTDWLSSFAETVPLLLKTVICAVLLGAALWLLLRGARWLKEQGVWPSPAPGAVRGPGAIAGPAGRSVEMGPAALVAEARAHADQGDSRQAVGALYRASVQTLGLLGATVAPGATEQAVLHAGLDRALPIGPALRRALPRLVAFRLGTAYAGQALEPERAAELCREIGLELAAVLSEARGLEARA